MKNKKEINAGIIIIENEVLYGRNKDIFFTEFKSIRYVEIDPLKISGSKEYNEAFFKQLDAIENNILDGQSFNETINERKY